MGGSHPAFEYSVSCMQAGKSVVTSNKEVVATYGAELLECAKENGVQYLFEASVGGGIPVIRGINTALAGDQISSVYGILNGTTNYILTKMRTESRTFDDVLKQFYSEFLFASVATDYKTFSVLQQGVCQ